MVRVMRSVLLAWIGVALAASGFAQSEVEVPFYLPTPEGWRTETLTFPLEFAPELEYEGLEELRFSPGMFKAMKVDFWSYAFVWWIPADTEISTERLENDLELYFQGLTEGVAKVRQIDPGKPDFTVRLEPSGESPNGRQRWEGTARTFDVFTTRQPIRLNVDIDTQECPDQGQLAVFFRLSPQPRRNPIWNVMADMRQGFRCEK